MSKLLLIIQREYLSLVARKSFIITTLLMPVLMVVCMLVPFWISDVNDNSGARTTVTVIDETGHLTDVIKANSQYEVIPLRGTPGKTDPRKFFKEGPSNVDALVVIPADVLNHPQVNVYSEKAVSASLTSYVTKCLNDTLSHVKLLQHGIPNLDKIVAESQVDVNVNNVKLAADGSQSSSSTDVAMLLGMILALVTYMFVIMYGAMIMNSVVEEKTNRIVEVIVSSCKPFQLMLGKIVGVGLVGLTQFAIWFVILSVIMGFMPHMISGPDAAAMAAASRGADVASLPAMAQVMTTLHSLPLGLIIGCFVIYFIGGYLLYASLFAGFGSAVDQASDTSQFSVPIIVIMIIALYVSLGCMENPNGSMAMWCSLIPFTSPIVMMVRLPFDVPLWQLALSIVLLFATAAAMVWLSGRIYRTGILLYGKKHSFKEILKWVK